MSDDDDYLDITPGIRLANRLHRITFELRIVRGRVERDIEAVKKLLEDRPSRASPPLPRAYARDVAG
jgi:hypothetical protein